MNVGTLNPYQRYFKMALLRVLSNSMGEIEMYRGSDALSSEGTHSFDTLCHAAANLAVKFDFKAVSFFGATGDTTRSFRCSPSLLYVAAPPFPFHTLSLTLATTTINAQNPRYSVDSYVVQEHAMGFKERATERHLCTHLIYGLHKSPVTRLN